MEDWDQFTQKHQLLQKFFQKLVNDHDKLAGN